MRKRILLLFLCFVLAVGIFPAPMSLAAEDAKGEIKAAAYKLVEDYAAKVNMSNSAEEAFEDFFIHGFFSGGRDMKLKEGEPMVAALFNSALMKECLAETIYRGILKMQQEGLDTLFAAGSSGWHAYGHTYSMVAYSDEGDFASHREYRTSVENFNKRMGTFCSPSYIYGIDEDTGTALYKGPLNRNDDVLELLAGETIIHVDFAKQGQIVRAHV